MKIQRVTFDEIEEFEALDIHDIPQETDVVWSITYDPITGKFNMAKIYNGYQMMINKAQLTKEFETRTDKLSVDRGFKFRKDWDLDRVVEALTDPATAPRLTTNTSIKLIEVAVSTSIDIYYTYTQNDGGMNQPSLATFYADDVQLAHSVYVVARSSEATIKLTTNIVIDIAITPVPRFDMTNMSANNYIKVIYPSFHGYKVVPGSGSRADVAEGDLTEKQLDDITATKDVIFNFQALHGTGALYYWFVVSSSHNPVSWVSIDSAGVEDGLNQGSISTLFEAQATTITYNGNSYTAYLTKQPTEFNNRVKIKF